MKNFTKEEMYMSGVARIARDIREGGCQEVLVSDWFMVDVELSEEKKLIDSSIKRLKKDIKQKEEWAFKTELEEQLIEILKVRKKALRK